MKKGGCGGGNTKTGIKFELKTSLADVLSAQKDYEVLMDERLSNPNTRSCAYDVYYKGEKVGKIASQHAFYRLLEKDYNIVWKDFLSKRLLPDDCIYVFLNNTFFIIECKHQEGSGSVDEKLQTCDFKRKQYQKLMSRANIDVEYVYLLDNWFRRPEYKDVLDYIISVNCQYYFEYIPLKKLGLPIPEGMDE